jgi:outer membrane protein OmpA-like peptidoglycan-associated protein
MKSFVRPMAAVLLFASFAFSQGGGDVKRHTIAVTYLRDPVDVQFAGTTLRPTARGEATVERWRKRNETEIDLKIENLIPAFNYGADYTTYVLWAITPEGQVSNLGEFRLSGGSARLKAATPLQKFAMIITAEPHYLVRLPSQMVILENLAPSGRNVQVEVSEVYFTGDSGRFYTDSTVPALAERDYNKIPLELLQARRAVQIARLADGERYDPNDYNAAVKTLMEAEAAHRRGASVHEVGRIARESISLAVRCRDLSEQRAETAERRAEIARRDEEVRRATETASDLQSELTSTENRLKASEIARTNLEDQLNRTMREAADSRAENRTLQSENGRLRDEVDRLRRDLSDARSQISSLQSQNVSTNAALADSSSRLAEIERIDRERRETEARLRAFEELRTAVSQTVTVKPSGTGFIAILPDNFFVTNSTDLALRIKAKMDALAQAIANNSSVVFTIEGHADARSTADSFALGRAQSVANYIAAYRVDQSRFKVISRGASVPVASNKTVRGKASNRRVEIIFAAP